MGCRPLLLALATAGIAFGARGADLHIAAVDMPESRALQALSGEWEAASGHRLIWTFLDLRAIGDRVRLEALAPASADAPAGRLDVATLGSLQLGIWGSQGRLVPLPEDGTDRAYGEPFVTETALTYYRADLFAARGLVMPEEPDLADLAAFAAALDAPEAGRAGICLAGQPGLAENLAVIDLFAHALGSDPFSPEAMDDRHGSWRAAVARYVELLTDFGPPDAGDLGTADLARRFVAGDCALWIGSSGALGELTKALGPDPTTWLGVALAPGAQRDDSVGWLRSIALAVPTHAPHPKAALDFVEWAASAAVLARAASASASAPFTATLETALHRAVPAGFETLKGEVVQDPLSVAEEIGQVFRATLTGELATDEAMTVAAALLDRLGPEPAMANGAESANGGRPREVPSLVRASRLFAGPSQFPPEAFAAYGILAFPARASSADRERQEMLCEAYVAALPRSDELGLPLGQQMVTVWPVTEDLIADELNGTQADAPCEAAVRNYGLPTALRALRDAGLGRRGPVGRGPYLLAWSPATSKGDPDAVVLTADLSDVTTAEQAATILALWRRDIEANPQLWEHGWNLEALRTGIRLWVDRVGTQIFAVLGA